MKFCFNTVFKKTAQSNRRDCTVNPEPNVKLREKYTHAVSGW